MKLQLGPVETKVAAGGGMGGLITLLFSLAAQYHWFTPPGPQLTGLIITAAGLLAGWLAPHTSRSVPPIPAGPPAAADAPPVMVPITVRVDGGELTPASAQKLKDALRAAIASEPTSGTTTGPGYHRPVKVTQAAMPKQPPASMPGLQPPPAPPERTAP